MSSKFFVALTSGDTVSCLQGTQDYAQQLKDKNASVRSSALYFYPKSLRKYILFSRSYPAAKHYDFFINEVDKNIWSDEIADRSLLEVQSTEEEIPAMSRNCLPIVEPFNIGNNRSKRQPLNYKVKMFPSTTLKM